MPHLAKRIKNLRTTVTNCCSYLYTLVQRLSHNAVEHKRFLLIKKQQVSTLQPIYRDHCHRAAINRTFEVRWSAVQMSWMDWNRFSCLNHYLQHDNFPDIFRSPTLNFPPFRFYLYILMPRQPAVSTRESYWSQQLLVSSDTSQRVDMSCSQLTALLQQYTCCTDRLQVCSSVHCRNVMLAVTFSLRLLVQLHSYMQNTQLLTITRPKCG